MYFTADTQHLHLIHHFKISLNKDLASSCVVERIRHTGYPGSVPVTHPRTSKAILLQVVLELEQNGTLWAADKRLQVSIKMP